jgi:cytochrome P450
MSSNLIAATGDEWRELRRKISPIFKPAKLKGMDDQISDCVRKFNTLLEIDLLHRGNGDVNLELLCKGLAIDVIGSCAFGIENDSLESNRQFMTHSENLLKPTFRSMVRLLVSVFSKKLLRLLTHFPTCQSRRAISTRI